MSKALGLAGGVAGPTKNSNFGPYLFIFVRRINKIRSIEQIISALARQHYITNRPLVTVLFLAQVLNKPCTLTGFGFDEKKSGF